MNQGEQAQEMSRLITRCWADEGFKQKLLADATATLKAEGVQLPPGVSFKALENDNNVVHLVIPAKPTELSDEDLDKVAGGIVGGPTVAVATGNAPVWRGSSSSAPWPPQHCY